MSSDFFQDTRGNLWWADFESISIMLRMWSQAKAYTETISIIEQNDLQELDFNQSRFRALRERYHQQEMGNVSQNIYTAPQLVVTQLLERYQQIPRLEQQKRRQFQRVQSHNYQVIDRRVTRAERTVTALQFTRDISGAIFMCCIPVSGLGVGAAMAARLAGSVFQGVATYQDTGNAGAAIATSVLSFKSSLMVLPETAGRAAQILFTVVNTGNTAVANSAVRMMTVEPGSTTNFTDVLRGELVSGGFDAAASPILGAVGDRLGGSVMPVAVEITGGQATSALSGAVSAAMQQPRGGGSSNSRMRGVIAVARLRHEVERRRSAAVDAAWESSPLYQYLATGDRNVLLSEAQRYVMGNLLRQGS